MVVGGQILKAEDMSRVLFCDLAGRPAPINIQRLEEVSVFS